MNNADYKFLKGYFNQFGNDIGAIVKTMVAQHDMELLKKDYKNALKEYTDHPLDTRKDLVKLSTLCFLSYLTLEDK